MFVVEEVVLITADDGWLTRRTWGAMPKLRKGHLEALSGLALATPIEDGVSFSALNHIRKHILQSEEKD